MKISIGCDHAGLELKKEIISLLKQEGFSFNDHGTNDESSVDYPDFGAAVSEAVSTGSDQRGILICGTGLGMSIVANKFKNIRACLCSDTFTAKMSRLHNDSNVLVLGGRVIGKELAREIVKTWLQTSFEGGRHQKRLDKITEIEKT